MFLCLTNLLYLVQYLPLMTSLTDSQLQCTLPPSLPQSATQSVSWSVLSFSLFRATLTVMQSLPKLQWKDISVDCSMWTLVLSDQFKGANVHVDNCLALSLHQNSSWSRLTSCGHHWCVRLRVLMMHLSGSYSRHRVRIFMLWMQKHCSTSLLKRLGLHLFYCDLLF